jgi:Peptidogalycan biosysnthesis/recognition
MRIHHDAADLRQLNPAGCRGRLTASSLFKRSRMGLSYRLFSSISDVDLANWQSVTNECGNSIFMDPRFIAAVEVGMQESCRFWHIIIYDETSLPVACASLSTISLDLAHVSPPPMASIMRRLPPVISNLRHVKILLCGLPISAGQNNLAIVSPHHYRQALSVLDAAISELAIKTRSHAILYKEFRKDDLERMNVLLNFGYRRIASEPMHIFSAAQFRDFEDYCARLKSNYRNQIMRSIKKFRRRQVDVSVLTDARQIKRVYTPEVHNLYYQVVDNAEMRLERLPTEFFHQLATRLEGNIELIIFSHEKRTVGFGWCLNAASIYYMLYTGFDHEINAELDLYFNMVYAAFDRALRKRIAKIHVGQTASSFKARLGCRAEPLYMFARGRGLFMPLIIRLVSHLIARQPPTPVFNVFRRDAFETSHSGISCNNS